MKKKCTITWELSVFLVAAILFVQLFTRFMPTDADAIRLGRVVVPQSYVEPTDLTANQLTYK